MSTGKTVGLAIIVVAIVPIILGMVWPTGTETVDSWEAQPGIDVTGDLASRDIAVYDTYTGPLNNLSIFRQGTDALQFPEPRDTTDTPNSYPVAAIEGTRTTQTVAIGDLAGTGKPRYGIGSYGGFTITGDTATYSYGDYWPSTNVLVLYDSDTVPARTVTPRLTDVITGSDLLITFGEPTEYIDLNGGLVGSSAPFAWVNGMHNRGVDLWIRMAHTPFASSFQVGGITLSWTGSTLTVDDGEEVQELGSVYSFVSLRISEDSAEVVGLIGADGFADSSYTEGNRLPCAWSGGLDMIVMKGTYADWWVKSTVSAISSTKGIKDSTLTPEAYYGTHSWQVTVVNPSTFGDTLTVGGLSYPVESGSIEVVNAVNGESSTIPVRGLRILSLVLDGTQRIFVGGVEVASSEPQDTTMTFGGEWYTSVVVAKVLQSETTAFTWKAGSFGLDKAGYCMAGMLSCVAVAIAGSVWGRRTGESVLALHVTMVICGAAYYCLI